ncbi:hypothetical protein HYPDE_23023 [Hyphomicrobium denitrificans 1NES1]|uniref:Uncharacterized protein n=1 Tax=Hyphomicrobium denitrificans 1NES1 TaxID=670307 RepID=N0B6W8_9HYPH|nr:hypothetical protein [Hyphomicrobium denitrificans]AGK56291.1 hypothetical protein HYPDE_23023 [Hyphomicrobium denitrificans 1NES1]
MDLEEAIARRRWVREYTSEGKKKIDPAVIEFDANEAALAFCREADPHLQTSCQVATHHPVSTASVRTISQLRCNSLSHAVGEATIASRPVQLAASSSPVHYVPVSDSRSWGEPFSRPHQPRRDDARAMISES